MRTSVGYLMRICTNRLLPQMEALFQDEELTFSQWTTLVALHDGRVTTASDLAYNICHDAGSLTRLIDQMVERGLVLRARDDKDRRVVRLALTPRGRKLVEALAPQVMNFWNGLLAGFSHARNRYPDCAADPPGDGHRGEDRPQIPDFQRPHSEKEKVMRKPLALLSALMLSACVATPPTDPQIKQVEQSSLGLTGAPAPQMNSDWWKAFNDPQLDALAVQVMAGNPTLAGALARLRSAQAELAINKAEDLPQVNLEGSEQRTLFSKDYIIPPPYGGTYHWYGSLTGNFSWNLDFWGKQAALIDKARYTSDATALDFEAARLMLSGAFAQAYVNLLLNYQNGDIADQAVAERTEIVKITQGRFDAGLENGSSVAQAQALLAQAKADQLRFAAAREMDVHAIVALTGQGANAWPTIIRPTPNLDVALPLPQTLPADLLARRPDILAARARIQAAVKDREAAHADFYPDINLEALAGFQSLGLANLLTGGRLHHGAGAGDPSADFRCRKD